LFETLSVEDWVTIQNVRFSFLTVVQGEYNTCPPPPSATSDPASFLIFWSHSVNGIILRFIDFFRQIDEFEGLNADDRFTLIKYNLLPLFPICKCFYFKSINDIHPKEDDIEKNNECHSSRSSGLSDEIRNKFKDLVISLITVTEQDPTLLSLLAATLIFSQGLSLSEDEPSLKDALAVNRAQSFYTKLLWKYLVNKYGEVQVCIKFTQLLSVIFKMQSAAKMFRDFFRVQLATPDTVSQLEPLIKTVLNIS
jgi:hypothetical protein